MFPGNIASRNPCFLGTWYKPHDTMHFRRFFGPTAVLGRSICILYCCIMDDDTNLLHLFCDIAHLAIGQHCATSGRYFSMFPSVLVNICILSNLNWSFRVWTMNRVHCEAVFMPTAKQFLNLILCGMTEQSTS